MRVDNFIREFKLRLDAVKGGDEVVKLAAAGLAGYFSLRKHEVGLFAINRKKFEISFLWPQGMANVGHIPLNAINSLVAKTANELVSTLDNYFAKSRHLFIFEFMLVEKSDRIPIQKIISVPVVAGGEAVAVIQIARKAVNLPDAGPDFTEEDRGDLEKIAALLSGYPFQTP